MNASNLEEFFTLGYRMPPTEDMVRLGQHWGWILATGIIYVILGILAFSMPLLSTMGVTLGLAALLVVGGVTHLIHAYQLRHQHGSASRFFQSVISLLTGLLIVRYPGGGMLGLAIALSFYFFISASAQWVLYSNVQPHRRWSWGLASALISFLLGLFIILNFPFSALWVPGTLLGIDLVFAGSAMAGLALHTHSLNKTANAGQRAFHARG